MRKTPLALSACVLVLVLAGCGGEDDTAGDPTPTPSQTPTATPSATATTTAPAPTGTVIDATIRGDDLVPNGERVKVKVGEEITINIDADRPGELHVHSTPEQQLDYPEGKSTVRLTIKTPGIVDVEDHHADKLLVSLEVS